MFLREIVRYKKSMKNGPIGAAKRMLRSSFCYILLESRYHSNAQWVSNVRITLKRDKNFCHEMSGTMKSFFIRRNVVYKFMLTNPIMYYISTSYSANDSSNKLFGSKLCNFNIV